MAEARWYTIKEVAERLRVSHDTVTRMVERGELPAIRVSARLIRIPVPAVERIERGEPTTRRAVVRRRVSKPVEIGADEQIPAVEPAGR